MKAIRHAGIVVSDLERSLRFYGEVLGLKMIKRADEPSGYIDKVCGLRGSKLTTVKLAAEDGSLVELLYFHASPAQNKNRSLHDTGLSHVAFTVEDVEKTYKNFREKGIEFVSPPESSPDGYAKIAFCKDPDGVYIEFVQVMERK